MTRASFEPDAELSELISSIFHQIDPVPEVVSKAARAAFEFRDLDAELIPLVDSLQTISVRSEHHENFISFALADLEIDISGSADRFGWHVLGQIAGPVSTVMVQTFTGAEPVSIDEYGRFSTVISAPTLCLRINTPDGRRLRTQWVTL